MMIGRERQGGTQEGTAETKRILNEALMLTNAAEAKYYAAKAKLVNSRNLLFDIQSNLIHEGKITGKNEDLRKAELFKYARDNIRDVSEKEQQMFEAKAAYQSAKRHWETLVLILEANKWA